MSCVFTYLTVSCRFVYTAMHMMKGRNVRTKSAVASHQREPFRRRSVRSSHGRTAANPATTASRSNPPSIFRELICRW